MQEVRARRDICTCKRASKEWQMEYHALYRFFLPSFFFLFRFYRFDSGEVSGRKFPLDGAETPDFQVDTGFCLLLNNNLHAHVWASG